MTWDLSLLQWESQSRSEMIIWTFLWGELWSSEASVAGVLSCVENTALSWENKTTRAERSWDEQVLGARAFRSFQYVTILFSFGTVLNRKPGFYTNYSNSTTVTPGLGNFYLGFTKGWYWVLKFWRPVRWGEEEPESSCNWWKLHNNFTSDLLQVTKIPLITHLKTREHTQTFVCNKIFSLIYAQHFLQVGTSIQTLVTMGGLPPTLPNFRECGTHALHVSFISWQNMIESRLLLDYTLCMQYLCFQYSLPYAQWIATQEILSNAELIWKQMF